MKPIHIKAYAKLNLTLDVLSRRKDGYHELESIMMRVLLHDTLSLMPAQTTSVSYLNIPAPDNDIVRRAIDAYTALTGHCASVEVTKRIPMEAGLGGGSADAAAALLAMQECYRALDKKELMDTALTLGADVPFCMQEKACLAKGVGELLAPFDIPVMPWFLIVKPSMGISTAKLFSGLKLPLEHRPDTAAALSTLKRGDLHSFGKLMRNALQPEAEAILPEISRLINRLREHNAIGACMTGSGSAVIGLFESQAAAQDAARNFYDTDFYTVTGGLI